MKHPMIFALILVLTLSLLTGCRGPAEEPTMAPTAAPTAAPTQAPQTKPSAPDTTEGTMMDPEDTLESTGSSEEASMPDATGNTQNGSSQRMR